MRDFLFTSESVTEGHPDKVCDQISDAILDACLSQDPNTHAGIETCVKDNNVFIVGEIKSQAHIYPEAIARNVIREIGYNDPVLGFDGDNAEIAVKLSRQSSDIAQGVELGQEIGAGDQGMMFGYADNQTPEFMPLPISLAHRLTRRLSEARRTGEIPWLKPDGKAQVTVEYRQGKPYRIDTVVVSAQHDASVSLEKVRETIKNQIIDVVLPHELKRGELNMHINPTGRFVIGGPVGDSGVTGRKIIVDTYGGWARHGGGAFSGKDPTKVDRSAAYAARQAALSIVAADLADKCEIQLSYAIGVAQPVSIHVTTFGTGRVSDEEIARLVSHIDFRPAAIIKRLSLQRPIYKPTAAFGHFGRPEFSWEKPLKLGLRLAFEA